MDKLWMTESGNFDVRGLYNAAVMLAESGHAEQARQIVAVADSLPVPPEIEGGVSLAAQAAYDAIN